MPSTRSFTLPKRMRTDEGAVRRVGFELEFTGVDLARVSDEVAKAYGGETRRNSAFEHTVENTDFGDFTLEVDAALLKDRLYIDLLQSMGVNLSREQEQALDERLLSVAAAAVPFELVTPPIPMDRLEEMQALEDILVALHAKGTKASPLYAFGMQFNPEAPSLEPESILSYMRAFFLLREWLEQEIDVDLSRRVLPFINPFPEDYVRMVLDPEYRPDMDRLIADYLYFNPTRNRPLDMTCLFAHIDERAVLSRVEDPHLVKPRPAYHYRLPDCRIDESDWSVAQEWNRWAEVERLAEDTSAIRRLSGRYLEPPSGVAGWLRRLEDWFSA